jgi:outer membrane cobalamin receptor
MKPARHETRTMLKTLRSYTMLTVLLFILPLRSSAEEDLYALSLSELMNITVTGTTLTKERLLRAPSAVTVFTRQQIRQMGVDSLDELINWVPGFQSLRMGDSPMDYTYGARGRRIADVSAEILVLLDGVRLSEPRSSSSMAIVPKYSLAQIERIEFIRGPGSAIYGSNAMMAVINMISSKEKNDVKLSVGALQRKRITLQNHFQQDQLQLDSAIEYDQDKGQDYQVADSFADGSTGIKDPRDSLNLHLTLHFHNTQVKYLGGEYNYDGFYVIERVSENVNRNQRRFHLLTLQQDWNLGRTDSQLRMSYTDTESTTRGQFTAAGALTELSSPSSSEPLLFETTIKGQELQLLWHNDTTFDEQNSIQFGFEARRTQVPEGLIASNFNIEQLAIGDFPVTSYTGLQANSLIQTEINQDIFGFYTQYQWHSAQTDITLGMRQDHFSDVGSQLSPRLAIVHEYRHNQTIKFLYGEAFRAPTANERGLVNNLALFSNPDLKPETVKSFDLIWMAQWTEQHLSIGYFESHFDDAILQATNNDGIRQYLNQQQDPSKGIELEYSNQLSHAATLRFTLSKLLDKPEQSFREADHLASALFNYHWPSINLNIASYYHSQRKTSKGDELAAYALVFAKIEHQLRPKLHLSLQAKNLLDKDFVTPVQGTEPASGLVNRGREWLLSLHYQY